MLHDADQAHKLDRVLVEAGLLTDIDAISGDYDVEPSVVRSSGVAHDVPVILTQVEFDDISRPLLSEPTHASRPRHKGPSHMHYPYSHQALLWVSIGVGIWLGFYTSCSYVTCISDVAGLANATYAIDALGTGTSDMVACPANVIDAHDTGVYITSIFDVVALAYVTDAHDISTGTSCHRGVTDVI